MQELLTAAGVGMATIAAMEHLWLFAVLVLGIVALPGMDMAFVLSSSLADGYRAGIAAVVGIMTGGVAHMAMGTAGLGVVLQVLPAAFNAMLFLGAAYLAWLGIALWRSPGSMVSAQAAPHRRWRGIFIGAAATSLLNPKAYIFMVAVFPQFIRVEQGRLLQQAVVMGTIVATIQALVYGTVALGAGRLREWLARSQASQVRLSRAVALLLVATAAWTVWESWRRI